MSSLLFADKFDSGDASAWTAATDITVAAGIGYLGAYGASTPADGTANVLTKTLTSASELYLRMWAKFAKLSTIPNTTTIALVTGLAGSFNVLVRRNGTAFEAEGRAFGSVEDAGPTPVTFHDQDWNLIELYGKRNTDGAKLWWNNALVMSFAAADVNNCFGVQIGPQLDWSDSVIYMDAVEIWDGMIDRSQPYHSGGQNGGAIRRRRSRRR